MSKTYYIENATSSGAISQEFNSLTACKKNAAESHEVYLRREGF